MVAKPAFLVSESFSVSLDEHAVQRVLFEDLTDTPGPCQVDFNQFTLIREKITGIDQKVRDANPSIEWVCICTEKGIYWLDERGSEVVLEHLKDSIHSNEEPILQQLWRWTTEEISTLHAKNIRMLILSAAHDLVLLQQFRTHLGRHHTLMYREFKQSERVVWNMIEALRDEMPKVILSGGAAVNLFERCLITQELLNRGVMTQDELGYDQEHLSRVYKILENRCLMAQTLGRTHVVAMHNEMEHNMRKAESSHLTRSTRWEMVFSLLGQIPAGFGNQFRYFSIEHERMSALVHRREMELGPTEEGQRAIKESDEMIEKMQVHSTEESENSSDQSTVMAGDNAAMDGATPSENSGKQKKKFTRMAAVTRQRR